MASNAVRQCFFWRWVTTCWSGAWVAVALLGGGIDARSVLAARFDAGEIEARQSLLQLAYLADPGVGGEGPLLPRQGPTVNKSDLRNSWMVADLTRQGGVAGDSSSKVVDCDGDNDPQSPRSIRPNHDAHGHKRSARDQRNCSRGSAEDEVADVMAGAAAGGANDKIPELKRELALLLTRTRAVLSELEQTRGQLPSERGLKPDDVVGGEGVPERGDKAAASDPSQIYREEDVWQQLVNHPQAREHLVARVQRRLAALGFDPGPIDGKYGPRTKAAVVSYQQDVGLGDDGRLTLALLDSLAAERPALQQEGDLVAAVQGLLLALDYDPGPVDGIAGPRTDAGVRTFQKAARLEPDGQVSDLLVIQLLAARETQLAEEGTKEPADGTHWQDFSPNGSSHIMLASLETAAAEDAAAKAGDDLVAEAQRLLADLGFEPGPVDGIAGPRTVVAVQAFQKAAGLQTDGQVSGALVTQLLAVRELQLDGAAPDEPIVSTGTEIDEEEIARALERTLIEEGGLLLPPFVLQAAPAFRYTHDSSSELRIVNVGGIPTVTQQDARLDMGEASLTVRLGLPWESQAEVYVPYVIATEDTVTAQTIEQDRSGNGLGDVEVAFAKQLLHEGNWLPNLLASLRWKSDSGEGPDPDSEDLSTGSGHHALQGGITLTKSFDPLVFFGTAAYTHNFSHEVAGIEVAPGNAINLGFGAILAAGPDTSLRVAHSQDFIDETAFDGEDFPGSDAVQSTFEVGASAVLSGNALFDVALGIGLTEDSPDYQIEASLPIRF